MRLLLSITAGIATWFFLDYWFTRHSGHVRIIPGELILFLKIVQPRAEFAALHIVPWLITGLLAKRREVLCGAVAAALSSAVDSALLSDIYHPGQYVQMFVNGTAVAIVAAAYGAAGGALGSKLARSNNSFKPSPLRGLGQNSPSSGGPA